MDQPRTAREALIAELLGDAGELLDRSAAMLDRSEKMATALPAATDQAAKALQAASDKSSREIAETGRRARQELDMGASQALQDIRGLTVEVKQAARVIDRQANRFVALALVVGMLGGLLSAALVGWVVVAYLL